MNYHVYTMTDMCTVPKSHILGNNAWVVSLVDISFMQLLMSFTHEVAPQSMP